MTPTKKVTSTPCSDWGRTWGLGTNRLGKLSKGTTPNSYIWKGKAQGRHGQQILPTFTVTFDYVGGEIINKVGKWDLPDTRDVLEAIRILNS